jgi:nitrate/nitrite transport system substrate-binding protein
MNNESSKTFTVDDEKTTLVQPTRRQLLQYGGLVGAAGVAATTGLLGGLSSSAVHAAGSDKPEKTKVKIGFIPLTDCASVVVASVLGIDKKYGITIELSKEASWAGVRDKLINGELDAAHVLYGLIYGVNNGIGANATPMAVLMNLNNNGQAITLANKLISAGITNGAGLKKHIAAGNKLTFAQTFPTGTHAMWLNYWLAANGVNPITDVKNITVPPPQMVSNMQVGNMDGYCVGEPWNARAIETGVGFTAATTQEIWTNHPEKVLGCTKAFVQQNPNTARALIMAVLEASRYLDDFKNRASVAKIISQKSYVNCPEATITGRFLGQYDNGAGKKWVDGNMMKFFNGGKTNFPYLSDGMWFMTQHKRWGLMKTNPDYLAIAKSVNQIDLYKEAATQVKVAIPSSVNRSSKLMDGKVWDGSNPAAYASSFAIKA